MLIRTLFPVLSLVCLAVRGQTKDEAFSPMEDLFLSTPSACGARESLHYITSIPHVAGTDGDHHMAEYVANDFQKAGIPDVSIFNLTAYLNYPREPPEVSLVSTTVDKDSTKVLFRASLTEEVLEMDSTSDTIWRNHTFHGYGASGDVTAPLVYANYGRPQDFDALDRAGISVKERLVLVRYGKCFRGLKVMNAQDRGAVGVIIYSDPADDGYGVGQVYPEGPWRPEFGVQRGSVQFNSKCAGDPMRADPRYQKSLYDICGVQSHHQLVPRIPSIPMGYGDARVLLEHLDGPFARDVGGPEWQGGLANLNYRVGPTLEGIELHLKVDNVDAMKQIPNVVGYIPGKLPPDQDMPVLLGNHRDAWVFGAADPNSGTATMLEVAKGLGKVLAAGYRPLRSIYLFSWSGEEYGLLGSTGWAELNADKVRRAVAYLNADTAVSGDYLSVALTPSLATLWEGVLTDLHGSSAQHSFTFQNGPIGEMRDSNTNQRLRDQNTRHKMLGSGSDYTVFLDHMGIPSLDFDFGKSEATYGQYHSIYDSFDWMNAYGGRDKEVGSAFELMVSASKIWGLLAVRLAYSNLLPLDHVEQGNSLANYVQTIESQHVNLDLDALRLAVFEFQEAARKIQEVCASLNNPSSLSCNEKIGLAERHFLSKEGLPGRPWFKHILQAPGLYLGYAAEAFPGIQQAIDDGDLDLAQYQVFEAAARIASAALSLRVDALTNDGYTTRQTSI